MSKQYRANPEIKSLSDAAEYSRSGKRWLAAVGAVALVGATVTGVTIYHEHSTDSCSASFGLGSNKSSQKVLTTPEGIKFKILVGPLQDGTATIGYLPYGPGESPQPLDIVNGTRREMADGSVSDYRAGGYLIEVERQDNTVTTTCKELRLPVERAAVFSS